MKPAPTGATDTNAIWHLDHFDYVLIALTMLAIVGWFAIDLVILVAQWGEVDALLDLEDQRLVMKVRIALTTVVTIAAVWLVGRRVRTGQGGCLGRIALTVMVIIGVIRWQGPVRDLYVNHHTLTVRSWQCPASAQIGRETARRLDLAACEAFDVPWIEIVGFPSADVRHDGVTMSVTNLPSASYDILLRYPGVGQHGVDMLLVRDAQTEALVWYDVWADKKFTDGVGRNRVRFENADVLIDIVVFAD